MTNRRELLQLLSTAATFGPLLKNSALSAPGSGVNVLGALQTAERRVEWRDRPLGIDTRRPRFTWNLTATADTRHLTQQACHVLVTTSPQAARAGRGDVWDSGKRSAGQLGLAPDHDLTLACQTLYYWSVAVWDQSGRFCGWSAPESFLTGILQPDGWRAHWIAAGPDEPVAPGPPPATNNDPPTEPRPLPLFRHDFEITRPVRQAVLCVSGLGQYELRLNGRRGGDGVLNPGWTNYARTVLYDTFEVTALLRPGQNTLGILLGNGMYDVEKYAGRYTKRVGSFGRPKLILQLKLSFADGSEQYVVSDSSWTTRPGPIVLSHTYGGEDFDARLEPEGWDQPNGGGAGWTPAVQVDGPGGVLRAQNVPPIKVERTLSPGAVTHPKPGSTVYDFGENFSGWPKISVSGPAGHKVKLIPGELLDEAGLVSQRSANAGPGHEVSFSYTLLGAGTESWAPRFTYYGFRYVQVDAPEDVEVRGLLGEFLHADLPLVGNFDCSNPLLVRIHQLIRQALLSNTMSVLTDCPQREKLGWLEQTHLNADTVFYNEEAVTLYEKMLRDMQDSQLANGMEPEIAPEYLAFLNADGSDSIFRDSPEWGAAMVLSPWATYRYMGDRRILENGYDSMARYTDYLRSRLRDGLLDFGLGDWYDIGPKPPGESQWTSRTLTGTAIYCEILLTLARIAGILGRNADVTRYAQAAAAATRTFNSKLFDPAAHRYDRGSMTANAMPLAIGLVPEAHRAAVLANLVADIRAHDNHVTSGDIGFHYVVLALMESDRGDVLYDMLSRTDSPSYGYQLAQGATALTEAWDANPTKSQNHFMLGHAETWLYGGLGGIRIDCAAPLEKRIRIAPQTAVPVESAAVRYRSVFGEIVSSWRKQQGKLHLHVEIPAGAVAQIELPAGAATESGAALSKARGIIAIEASSRRLTLTAGSGRYDFETATP